MCGYALCAHLMRCEHKRACWGRPILRAVAKWNWIRISGTSSHNVMDSSAAIATGDKKESFEKAMRWRNAKNVFGSGTERESSCQMEWDIFNDIYCPKCATHCRHTRRCMHVEWIVWIDWCSIHTAWCIVRLDYLPRHIGDDAHRSQTAKLDGKFPLTF